MNCTARLLRAVYKKQLLGRKRLRASRQRRLRAGSAGLRPSAGTGQRFPDGPAALQRRDPQHCSDVLPRRRRSTNRCLHNAYCPGRAWAWLSPVAISSSWPRLRALGQSLVDEFPEFTAAYDFLAEVREEMGKLAEAQSKCCCRQRRSLPTTRRDSGWWRDLAMRNNDLQTAEKAYGKVLDRRRGSTLSNIDDYTNLSRVLLDSGQTDGAQTDHRQLRRDWRGSKQGRIRRTGHGNALRQPGRRTRRRPARPLNKSAAVGQRGAAGGRQDARCCRRS
jgi:hypothetical protein